MKDPGPFKATLTKTVTNRYTRLGVPLHLTKQPTPSKTTYYTTSWFSLAEEIFKLEGPRTFPQGR